MDRTLPVVDATAHRRQPWLLHVLDVNALNFCAFAICLDGEDVASAAAEEEGEGEVAGDDGARAVLVGVPNAIDSGGVWNVYWVMAILELIMRIDRRLSAAYGEAQLYDSGGQGG